MNDAETGRVRLLDDAARLLTGYGDGKRLSALAWDLFARTSQEDLATYAAEEIAACVRSADALLASRSVGRHSIRIEDLTAGPRIDQLSSASLDWPRGFGQYTVGGRFVHWIAQQYGLGALRDLSHDFGGRAIPLAMNISATINAAEKTKCAQAAREKESSSATRIVIAAAT